MKRQSLLSEKNKKNIDLSSAKFAMSVVTVKVLNHNGADIFIFFISEKIRLDISCESSARQMIHMQCQVLYFFLQNNLKKIRMPSHDLLQFFSVL